MKTRFLPVIALLMGLGLWRPASAADTPPVLVHAPTRDDVLKDYPTTARLNGVSGEAVLRCTVTTSGTLDPCGVLSQSPTWTPFGEVALRLAHIYRYRPATHDGVPISSSLDVPVEFVAPPPDLAAARRVSAGGSAIWKFVSIIVVGLVVSLMFRRRKADKRKPLDLAGD